MTNKYYMYGGKMCRALLNTPTGAWVILCVSDPPQPFHVPKQLLYETSAPERKFQTERTQSQVKKQTERLALIQPLIGRTEPIYDKHMRNAIISEIAQKNNISKRTIQRLYYSFLAGGAESLFPESKAKGIKLPKDDVRNIRWAIRTYHYSAHGLSLQRTYEMMLAQKYLTQEGVLTEHYPTYNRFKNFFYNHMRNTPTAIISQKGLSYYQRNARPLYGKSIDKTPNIGMYEIDATEADVFITSRYNRNQSIGRPIVYIAVDRASQLIAGIYVGLNYGETSVIECLRNAIMDKVDYCKQFDIDITAEQWPAAGIPGTIVTDRGREFTGMRLKEICSTFGITFDYLPPYRPELKGTVEKTFDILQQQLKPLLFHRGGINSDFSERGAPDYRLEATLTLPEYTKLVIMAVIQCNALRVLKNYLRPPEMAASQIPHTPAAIWQWHSDCGYSLLKPLILNEASFHLLARGKGYFTRKGLEFKTLTYFNKAFDSRCVTAGIKGKEPVTIAYNPNNTTKIWLYEDGAFYEFLITSASSVFSDITYEEVTTYKKAESSAQRQEQALLLEQNIAHTAAMRRVVEQASTQKTSVSPEASLERIKQTRKREEDSNES